MVDYSKDFRSSRIAGLLARQITALPLVREIRLMEICGSHTVALFKSGIRKLLPSSIHLLSGPGCPVCVTGNGYIDCALTLAEEEHITLCTFGDMLRVPGSRSSLERARARGRSIQICLSPAEAVMLAAARPKQRFVFLAIGFETTAPVIAAAVKMAAEKNLTNFFILSALKTLPRALEALVHTDGFNVQGFICPGHVAVITGTTIFNHITHKYGYPCVVTGFEPLDLLQGILMLGAQIAAGKAEVAIQYTRAVTREGNRTALRLMEEVFTATDAQWRGLGIIPGSGLELAGAYSRFDALRAFSLVLPAAGDYPGCLCGNIMRGVNIPPDCRLFGAACTPRDPKGACMVSSEGTCAAWYKYGRGDAV